MVGLRGAAVKTRFSIIALATAVAAAASQHAYYGFMVLPLLGDHPLRINEVVMNTRHKLSLIISIGGTLRDGTPTTTPQKTSNGVKLFGLTSAPISIDPGSRDPRLRSTRDRHTTRSFGASGHESRTRFSLAPAGLRPN